MSPDQTRLLIPVFSVFSYFVHSAEEDRRLLLKYTDLFSLVYSSPTVGSPVIYIYISTGEPTVGKE